LKFDITSFSVSSLAPEDFLFCKPVLHHLKRKIADSVNQRRWKFPVEPSPKGREGIKLLPSLFPALPERLGGYLLREEMGGGILRVFL